MMPSPEQLLPIVQECWSVETSGQWLPDNPARGQCNVTSLVVHDRCGGEILKTWTPDGWHFYNRVDGKRHDLTASQFTTAIPYGDVESIRAEALAGTTPERYAILKARVEQLHAAQVSRGRQAHAPNSDTQAEAPPSRAFP